MSVIEIERDGATIRAWYNVYHSRRHGIAIWDLYANGIVVRGCVYDHISAESRDGQVTITHISRRNGTEVSGPGRKSVAVILAEVVKGITQEQIDAYVLDHLAGVLDNAKEARQKALDAYIAACREAEVALRNLREVSDLGTLWDGEPGPRPFKTENDLLWLAEIDFGGAAGDSAKALQQFFGTSGHEPYFRMKRWQRFFYDGFQWPSESAQ